MTDTPATTRSTVLIELDVEHPAGMAPADVGELAVFGATLSMAGVGLPLEEELGRARTAEVRLAAPVRHVTGLEF